MNPKRKIANNCEKATFLIEKKQFESITLKDNMELKIHLAGCAVCRTYQHQSVLINKVTQLILNEKSVEASTLDESVKMKMQQSIERSLKK
ncbi:MAG: hypothetical protein ABI402_12120 [Ferruginibacter sp.]